MAAFFSATLNQFLTTNPADILRALHREVAANFTQFQTAQHGAWEIQLPVLKTAVAKLIEGIPAASAWGILLEYDIPGRSKRLDVVILCDRGIIPIEFKVGAQEFRSEDRWQLKVYSWNLRDFHRESRGRFIGPILVATEAPRSLRLEGDLKATDKHGLILKMQLVQPADLPLALSRAHAAMPESASKPIDVAGWNSSLTEPTESIIQAAQRLFGSHDVREIDHAQADNTDEAVEEIIRVIQDAKKNRKRSICFVTGVPGAGKTLVGLRAAYSPHVNETIGSTPCFASGNIPLINVLTRALEVNRTRQRGTRRAVVHEVAAPFWNVHRFAASHLNDAEQRPPSFRVVIFDEAQRVWDREKVFDSQKKRQHRKGDFDKLPESLWNNSEPELLLQVMERYEDWCVIVALVGGGQEIHDGEAGLAAWGQALASRKKDWAIWSSPIALQGGSTLSGKTLFADAPHFAGKAMPTPALHLSVTKRSARAERLTEWVDCVLRADAAAAHKLVDQISEFPIALVRDLSVAKKLLRRYGGSEARFGLIASSEADRLRAEGIEVSMEFRKGIRFPDWFVQPPGKIDSSNQLEVAATEFECQGLELDWTCVCWGNDFVFDAASKNWNFWRLWGTTLRAVPDPEEQNLARNVYRVLLTRAREGMILFVPKGDPTDSTRPVRFYDETVEFLKLCGLKETNG